MSANAALLTRPPLQLAIGQLTAAEQSHVQISLRVLSSKLKVPCVVSSDTQAEITLKPCDKHVGDLCLISAYGETHVERPVRLVPLSDALSEIIDGILAKEGQGSAAEASPANDAAATAPVSGSSSLLSLLLRREERGPLQVTFESGAEMLVDDRFHTAYLPADGEMLLPRLGQDGVRSVQQVGSVTFKQKTGKGASLHPISVEQLCWSLPADADVANLLDRWHDNAESSLRLVTWPNLSTQPDALQWLEVMTALAYRPMTVANFMQFATAAGISAERARHGLSLLCVFRHVEMTAPVATEASVFASEPSVFATSASQPPSGILGRLRSRLRGLVG